MREFETDFVVLDTETTGLDEQAEIVELSIINKHGSTLFDSLIKPKGRIPRDAERIHGISNNDVKNADNWPEVYEDVKNILNGVAWQSTTLNMIPRLFNKPANFMI